MSLPLETRAQSWKALLISRDATSAFLQHLQQETTAWSASTAPWEAGSWAFGIISYFINGLNSYSWGQLEGLTGFNYAGKQGSQKHLPWSKEKQPGESEQAKGDLMAVSHATEWGLNHAAPWETKQQSLSQTESRWSLSQPFLIRLCETSWVYTTLIDAGSHVKWCIFLHPFLKKKKKNCGKAAESQYHFISFLLCYLFWVLSLQ